MKIPHSVILITCCLIGGLSGCTNQGLALRDSGPHAGSTNTVGRDRLAQRDSYIDHHYKTQLKSGRASNEEEARALASLEWERQKYRSKLESQ